VVWAIRRIWIWAIGDISSYSSLIFSGSLLISILEDFLHRVVIMLLWTLFGVQASMIDDVVSLM
jgi:hypothetical protein